MKLDYLLGQGKEEEIEIALPNFPKKHEQAKAKKSKSQEEERSRSLSQKFNASHAL